MNTILLKTIVGSTVHGTSVDDGLEDLDLMSIVIEEDDNFLGLEPVEVWTERTKPEGVRSEAGDVDHTIYGLRKYLRLALRQNPTIMLALFSHGDFIVHRSSLGVELQGLAPLIVSKNAYNTFRGYMHKQRERMMGTRGQKNVTRPELIEKYGYDTKYAGHIIRLGYQGEEILRTGRIELPMRDDRRQVVLDVRTGKYTLAQVEKLALAAEYNLEQALRHSDIRAIPDWNQVEKWMVSAYMRVWTNKG